MFKVKTIEAVMNYLRVWEGAEECEIENYIISYWKDGNKVEARSIFKIIEEMEEKGIDTYYSIIDLMN